MSVTKRPNGRWRARYRDAEGKEHAKDFRTKAEAGAWEVAELARLQRGEWIDPRAGRITFREYTETWLAAQNHRPGTVALYERNLRLRVYPVFGDRPLGSIKHTAAKSFVSGLERTRLAPDTIRQAHALARTIFAAAVADQIIPSSPFRQIKLPAVGRRKVAPVDVSIVGRQHVAAGAPLRALVALGFGSGLRSGEMLGLDVDRIDFLRGEVVCDQQLVYVTGQPPYLAEPKSPDSTRTIPLPRFAIDALAAHLAEFPPEWVEVPRDAPDGPIERVRLVFRADKGGPMLRTTFNGRWRALCGRAPLVPKGNAPHRLRHAYASVLIAGGVPFTTVQELLGHAAQGTTWGVYVHQVEGWERQVRSVMEAAWEQATSTSTGPLSLKRASAAGEQ